MLPAYTSYTANDRDLATARFDPRLQDSERDLARIELDRRRAHARELARHRRAIAGIERAAERRRQAVGAA